MIIEISNAEEMTFGEEPTQTPKHETQEEILSLREGSCPSLIYLRVNSESLTFIEITKKNFNDLLNPFGDDFTPSAQPQLSGNMNRLKVESIMLAEKHKTELNDIEIKVSRCL